MLCYPFTAKTLIRLGGCPRCSWLSLRQVFGLAMLSRAHIIHIGDYFYIYLTCLDFSGPIEFSTPMEQGAPSCNNTDITSSFQIKKCITTLCNGLLLLFFYFCHSRTWADNRLKSDYGQCRVRINTRIIEYLERVLTSMSKHYRVRLHGGYAPLPCEYSHGF